jgi:hypothetical protein
LFLQHKIFMGTKIAFLLPLPRTVLLRPINLSSAQVCRLKALDRDWRPEVESSQAHCLTAN